MRKLKGWQNMPGEEPDETEDFNRIDAGEKLLVAQECTRMYRKLYAQAVCKEAQTELAAEHLYAETPEPPEEKRYQNIPLRVAILHILTRYPNRRFTGRQIAKGLLAGGWHPSEGLNLEKLRAAHAGQRGIKDCSRGTLLLMATTGLIATLMRSLNERYSLFPIRKGKVLGGGIGCKRFEYSFIPKHGGKTHGPAPIPDEWQLADRNRKKKEPPARQSDSEAAQHAAAAAQRKAETLAAVKEAKEENEARAARNIKRMKEARKSGTNV